MAGQRRAEIGLFANPRKMGPGLRQAEGMLAGFGRKVKGAFGRVLGAGAGFAARSLDPLGRAFDLIASQADEVVNFERGIARMAIAQGKSNDEMAAFRQQLVHVSDETGVARGEILQGASAYQALTGDTAGAAAAARTFARVSQATGSTVADVATTAAALGQNLGVLPEQLEDAFSILNVQGKAGAIELKDLAALMASLSAQSQRFKGGKGVEGMAEAGAALQVIRRNFGSASEAATGFESLMSSIVKNAKNLEKAGVKVFDKNPKTGRKTLRGFSEIIESIGRSKLMKDPTLLSKALGRVEAERALQALTSNWTDFKALVDTTDVKSIGRDMEQYLASPAGQLDQSMNRLKKSAAEAFTPERIQAFAEMVEGAANAISRLIDGINVAGNAIDAVTGKDSEAFLVGEKVLGAKGAAGVLDRNPHAYSRASRDVGGILESPFEGNYNVGRAAGVGAEFGAADVQRRAARDAELAAARAKYATPVSAAGAALAGGVTPAALTAAIERSRMDVTLRLAGGDAIATAVGNAQQNRRHP